MTPPKSQVSSATAIGNSSSSSSTADNSSVGVGAGVSSSGSADGKASTAASSSNTKSQAALPSATNSALARSARSSPAPSSLPPSLPSQPSSTNAQSSSHKQSAPSVATYSVLPKMSDPTPHPTAAMSSSKRMQKDAGAGAGPDANSAGAASTLGGPSPYGTRSRNRTGGARPNYAEDKDIDFEMYPERREDDPRKPASRTAAPSTANGAPSAPPSSLEREPLRPTSGSTGNSASSGPNDRVRKPLPTGTAASSSDGNQSSQGNQNSQSHSSSVNSSGRSAASHTQPKEPKEPKEQNAPSAPSAPSSSSANGSQTHSNPRKRKAAAAASEKSSASGGTAQNSSGNSHSNSSSVRKGGASAAATAAATAVASQKRDVRGYANTNLLTFEKRGAKPNKDGKMVADDGTILSTNDHVYLVCEPPGEPYYLARVMEFLHAKNDPSLPVDALRVNWYYRPRDIGRKAQDTRFIFATMHSDTTPLTALRGKCTIQHKAEIENFDEFRKTPDCFWFEKLYDRYIQKNYEIIPTFQIVNVPERVKKVLHERWRYVLVEQGRGKDLTAAAKQCKRCSGFCASNNSVDCAVCANTYHMNCVRPPLLKKPSRGFAWSCAACSRAQERLLEARHTPNVIDGRTPDAAASAAAADDEDFDDDDDAACPDTNRTSPENDEDAHPPATAEQQYQASLWPYRYLGMHCKVEDALDYDDRIYPRAATRVGPRHQANIGPWPGQPVQYVMPPDIKKATRREARQNREALAAYERERESRPKWIQDTPPGYVERGLDLDEDDPKCTSYLVYKPPPSSPHSFSPDPPDMSKMEVDDDNSETLATSDEDIDKYMAKAVSRAPKLGVPPRSTNLYHVAMVLLFKNTFNPEKALKELDQQKPIDFKEPMLTPAELKRFEEAVLKFGSELNQVTRHVKTVFYGDIVRFYYTWKKSDRGKQVWGNNAGRKGKKEAKEAKKAEAEAASKFQDDVADDNDDSAFDTDKAEGMKRQFLCKFCSTKSSRQWRRAPAMSPTAVLSESLGGGSSKNSHRDRSHNQHNQQYVVSLCRRCAELWRRYAVQWEDTEALTQKAATLGARLLKRKIDEEIFKEISAADEMMQATEANYNARHPNQNGPASNVSEPPRKRLKGHSANNGGEKDGEQNASDSTASTAPPAASSSSSRRRDRSDKSHADKGEKGDKTTTAEKAATGKAGVESSPGAAASRASSAPEIPQPRKLPCAICNQMELPTEDQRLSCRDCRMTVHRSCYGVTDNRNPAKWLCDMCSNDRNPQVSIDYRCVLCPVEQTEHDFVEPPRTVHKKKSDKDRERERTEREQAQKAAEYYRRRQEELNKPIEPREPLKRTADNNWVHVTCAVWTPEVRFGDARALEPSEGIPSVPRARYGEECKVCRGKVGACVSCHQCRALFHVECAHQAGHIFGFDLVPIKGSRRDQANMVTINGVTGLLTAAIWCKEHVPLKSSVHLMHETIDNSKMTALQLYVDHYKQADLALTGCARKANLLTLAAKMSGAPGSAGTVADHFVPPLSGSAGDSGSGNGNGNGNGNGSSSSSSRRASLYLNGSASNGVSNGTSGSRSATPESRRPGGKICFTCGTDVSPKWYQIDKAQEREMTNGFYGKLGSEAQKFVAQRNFQCHKCKKAGKQPLPHDHYSASAYSSTIKTEEEPCAEAVLQRLAPQYHQQSHLSQPQSTQPQPQSQSQSQPQHQPQYQPQSQHQSHQPHQQLQQPPQRPPLHHYHTSGEQSTAESARMSLSLSHSHSHSHSQPPTVTASPLPPPGASGMMSSAHSPDRNRYWQSTTGSATAAAAAATASSSSAIPPPPAPLSMRPSSGSGSPPTLVAHSSHSSHPSHPSHAPPIHHPSHSPPIMHPAPRPSIMAPRTIPPPPPPPPLSPYGASPSPSSSVSGYPDWRRAPSSAPVPLPHAPPSSSSSSSRRDPLSNLSNSSAASSSIPPLAQNHLRPPPLSIPHSASSAASSSMQNGGAGGSYLGQGLLIGRPPSPRLRMGGGPLSHSSSGSGSGSGSGNTGNAYSHGHNHGHGHSQGLGFGHTHGSGHTHPPYGPSASPPLSSRMVNGGSGHIPFSQVLHPHRSSSSPSSSFASVTLGANNVTREDFTNLGRDRDRDREREREHERERGPLGIPRASDLRTNEARSGSAASSSPSLRNLLS